MFRRLAVVVGVAALFTAAGVGTAMAAGNACDATVTKFAGKKVACITGVIAHAQMTGTPTRTDKIAKCKANFMKKCSTVTGCVSPNHTGCAPGTQPEDEADAASEAMSPGGAFLK